MKWTFLPKAHLVGLILGFIGFVELKHLVKRQKNLYDRRWRKEDFPIPVLNLTVCGFSNFLCDPGRILQLSLTEGTVCNGLPLRICTVMVILGIFLEWQFHLKYL